MAHPSKSLSLVCLEAVIFDLDGVLTDTASAHFEAWKETFDELLRERDGADFDPFTQQDYLDFVDGKPRYEGVQSFLEARGIDLPMGDADAAPGLDSVYAVGTAKNERYQAFLSKGHIEVFDDAVRFVEMLRERGVRTAVVSSSKNCKTVLDTAGLAHLFAARVDGNDLGAHGLAGKPEPDMFIEAAGRLGTTPRHAVVVEDAVSGVQAGRRGHFCQVIGMARGDDAAQLSEAGADIVISSFDELQIAASGERMPKTVKSGMESLDEIVEQVSDKHLAVFLDYDGTLTPIVDQPDQAVLSDEMKQTVERLGAMDEKCTVAVVSGRDLGDVRERVGIDNIAYAGSHGFDILGPEGESMMLEKGEDFVPALDRAEEELRRRTRRIEGALLERKRYSLAVHYRQVANKDVPTVEKHVDQVVDHISELRKTHGKKVYDLQPNIDWDKGKAVDWLLDKLGLAGDDVVPMYIGDDVTDEDAFRALEGRGITLAVQDVAKPTAADYRLADPDAVKRFLDNLADRL
ncbi:trehalose-phosphatase [Persicimonas caeni]|uniref:Trehalose 6-phosphate phosphatase n=1 Tax=Persicimonas caeni TaxID=2292766 RepID=A0A4Y6PQI7_PERCE|nr:trehalose-phosphatase [Persicimonas caeni]QDG50287.1 trehalose-phosphatase [Persicimonas caeni]QED31508.1 trehalose-phosphatase [Persicimonas caeni]